MLEISPTMMNDEQSDAAQLVTTFHRKRISSSHSKTAEQENIDEVCNDVVSR